MKEVPCSLPARSKASTERSIHKTGFLSDAELDSARVPLKQSKHPPLAQFLVRRAIQNPRLGNFLFWYLVVESPDEGEVKKPKAYGKSYKKTLEQFLEELRQVGVEYRVMSTHLRSGVRW